MLKTTLIAGLLGLATPALAVDPIVTEICPTCTSITLTGNADFQATGGRNFIEFAPQATGSATFLFGGLNPNDPYFIDVVGQNSANAMFEFTLNSVTGLGTYNLDGFALGAVDLTFSFLSNGLGGGSLLITSVDGNFEGKIDSIGLRLDVEHCPDCVPTPTAVPGPVAGAGAVPLLAWMGFVGFRRWRRRGDQA